MADGSGFGRGIAAARGAASARIALDLTADQITLLTRSADRDWAPVAVAAIDTPDFARAIDWLRSEALVRGGPGCAVTLFLPPEQILQRRAALPPREPARSRAARAVVEDSSIYSAGDLALAVSPDDAAGQATILATLAQTWREARDYTTRWGFAVGAVSTRIEAAAFGAAGPVFTLAGDPAARSRRGPLPGGTARRGLVLGGAAVAAALVLLTLWTGGGNPGTAWPPVGDLPPSTDNRDVSPGCCNAPNGPVRADRAPLRMAPGPELAQDGLARAPLGQALPRIGPSPVRLRDPVADAGLLTVGPGPVLPQRPLVPGAPLRLGAAPAPTAPTTAARYARQPSVAAASGDLVRLALAGSGMPVPDLPLSDAAPAPDFPATVDSAAGGADLTLAAGAPARAPTPPAGRSTLLSSPVLPGTAQPAAGGALARGQVPMPPPRPRLRTETATAEPPAPVPGPSTPVPNTPVAVEAPVATLTPAPGPTDTAVPETTASRYARASAPLPPTRPLRLRATLPTPGTSLTRAPSHLPTPGSTPVGVQQLATEQGLPTNRTALIGILNLQNGRQALLRLPDGSFERVRTGDVLDGWRVSVIGRDAMRLTKGGEDRTLLLVDR